MNHSTPSLTFFLTIMAVLTQTSCITEGNRFPSDTSWIKTGSTTKADVSRMLGEPFSVGATPEYRTWTYGYYRYRLIGSSYNKELKIYWDNQDSVANFSFHSNFPADKQLQLGKP